jgi:hypothetical protein
MIDHGRSAPTAIAAKRADYFVARTRVVWGVDLESDDVIKAYDSENPETPRVFRRGDVADAEPVASGWTVAVDESFG